MNSNHISLSGSKFLYEYRQVTTQFSKGEIIAYCDEKKSEYDRVVRNWNEEVNSEWLVRHYLSVKMILAASLMLGSLEFSETENVQVVQPYLVYYSIFHCCRALLYTIPSENWNKGKLVSLAHDKVIARTGKHLKRLSGKYANEIEERLNQLRKVRNLFSYRFPANGLKNQGMETYSQLSTVIDDCVILVGIAQLNSECLEQSISKFGVQRYAPKVDDIGKTFLYEGPDGRLVDQEDYYRIDYMRRKMPIPTTLALTMTEGLIEDFFGSWLGSTRGKQSGFDPDEYWRIIFDVP